MIRNRNKKQQQRPSVPFSQFKKKRRSKVKSRGIFSLELGDLDTYTYEGKLQVTSIKEYLKMSMYAYLLDNEDRNVRSEKIVLSFSRRLN